MTSQPPPPSPPPPGRSRRRTALIALAAAVMVALGAAVQVGSYYYRRYGPAPLCNRVPLESRPRVVPFRLSDPDAAAWLGSKSDLACPEAGRSYSEWYFTRVLMGDYFLDAILQTREAGDHWGLVSFHVRDSGTLQAVAVNMAMAKQVEWARKGCAASMLSRGQSGKWKRSYIRLLHEGPHAGSFELEMHAPRGRLRLYLQPVTAGLRGDQVGGDGTRPGSWFQYSSVFALGRASGEIVLTDPSGKEQRYAVAGPEGGPAMAYLEHMWGQHDRPPLGVIDRNAWDWGNWPRLGPDGDIMSGQIDGLTGGLEGFGAVFFGDTTFAFAHNPPEEMTRTVYSRLEPIKGFLYPQDLHIWARGSISAATINMRGFIRSSFFDWLTFDLYGRAGDDFHFLDWNSDPVWGVIDFYKGAQAREELPGPAYGLLSRCSPRGCRVSWKGSRVGPQGTEYWVFRVEAGDRLGAGVPVGMLPSISAGCSSSESASGSTSDASAVSGENELEFLDPGGKEQTVYKVVPVSVPDTLFHRRVMAGYARCSLAAEAQPPPVTASAELAAALEPARAESFKGAVDQDREMPGSSPAARVRLVRTPDSGALEFHLETKDAEQWGNARTLRPRFSARTQVQSFFPLGLGPDRIALAWSERTPVLDGAVYTDWEVFAAVVNLNDGSFRVIDVSMSDFDSVGVSLSQHEDKVTVLWQECAEGFCIPAREDIEVSAP